MVLTLHGADGNAVRGMQQFLGEGKWDDWVIRQRHWQEVNTTSGGGNRLKRLVELDFHPLEF